MARPGVAPDRESERGLTPPAETPPFRRGLRLRTKLTLVFSTIFVLFAASVIAVTASRSRRALLESAQRHVLLRIHSLAQQSRSPLLNNNDIDLQRILEEEVQGHADILWAGAVDGAGKPRVTSSIDGPLRKAIDSILARKAQFDRLDLQEHRFDWEGKPIWVLEATAPILVSADQRWGGVRTLVSLEPVQRHLMKTVTLLGVTSLATLIFGCGLIFTVARHLSTPIEELALSTQSIAKGKFEEVPDCRTGGEIGVLSDHFEEMASKLADMRSELELRAQEAEDKRVELDTVLSSLVDGVLAVNRDLTIRFVNWTARQLLALPLEDLTNTPLLTVVGNVAFCELMEGALANPSRPVDREIEVKSIDGETPLIIRVRISGIGNDWQGAAAGAVAVLQDVTKLRQAQQSQKRLLTNVSHELRTPVSVLRLSATNLKRYPEMTSDRRQGILQTIDRETTRLQRMIEDLLDISRLEVKGLSLRQTPRDLQEIVNEVIATSSALIQESGVQLYRRHARNAVVAQVDEARIFQVITNLLRNSLNFTASGKRVAIWVCRAEEGLRHSPQVGVPLRGPVARICVFDRGIGISNAEVSHIFDRFYRIENEVHTIEGTGVGLAIVKEVVLKHGGAIFVTSVTEKGSLITVELPINNLAAAPGEISSDSGQTPPPTNHPKLGDDLPELPQPGAMT